jgi:hypothetical protein
MTANTTKDRLIAAKSSTLTPDIQRHPVWGRTDSMRASIKSASPDFTILLQPNRNHLGAAAFGSHIQTLTENFHV